MEGADKIKAGIEKEKQIALGEITPKNRLQNQIRLAEALWNIKMGENRLDTLEDRDNVMLYWDEQGFSSLYSIFEGLPEFKTHPRLRGDIFKITIQDLLYFKENQRLPED
jgi:hypothetical protein